jgi:peptidyl-prolyl cis-trans isomerase SurA
MRIPSLALFGLMIATPALAQQVPAPAPAPRGGEELIDRVAAVVGDTVLLLSDVQGEIEQMRASGRPLPTDAAGQAKLAQQILDAKIDDLVLLEAARQAKITVEDSNIEPAVDENIRQVQSRFGSEAEFRRALQASGTTLEQYRATLLGQYRDRAMIQRFTALRLASAPRPAVSEADIRAFFDAQSSSLDTRPANISFEQLILEPQASPAAKQAALAKAQDVLKQIRDGGDFEVLAKRFSDDPGSKEHGGDLGWFKRGRMVPAFENVAFALKPGEVSPVIETEFGYHIIKVTGAKSSERQARHILIRPEITDADIAQAKARADSIAEKVRGGAPLPATHAAAVRGQERTLEHIPVNGLPAGYSTALADATPGTVVGPFELEGPTGPSFVVARVTARQEEGTYTLDDVRDQVRARVQQEQMMDKLVAELRKSMHVSIQL